MPRFVDALPALTFRWVERCGHVPHLEQPAVVADAIEAALAGAAPAGDGEVGALGGGAGGGAGGDLLARLDAFLDRPLLDTNVRGGPLEPFKRFARLEPELAQALASVIAVSFFALLGKLAFDLALALRL